MTLTGAVAEWKDPTLKVGLDSEPAYALLYVARPRYLTEVVLPLLFDAIRGRVR